MRQAEMFWLFLRRPLKFTERRPDMRAVMLIATGLLLICAGLSGLGCKKKEPKHDIAYFHSPAGIYEKINESRLQLTAALEKKELQYIHDSMYYFKDLLVVLSNKLEGEKKQRVDSILRDLTQIANAIDNSAGRGNQEATEKNIQHLIERLKELETEVKEGK